MYWLRSSLKPSNVYPHFFKAIYILWFLITDFPEYIWGGDLEKVIHYRIILRLKQQNSTWALERRYFFFFFFC